MIIHIGVCCHMRIGSGLHANIDGNACRKACERVYEAFEEDLVSDKNHVCIPSKRVPSRICVVE